MQPQRPLFSTLAGAALIVMPLLGLALKFGSPGWLLVIFIWGLFIPFAIGYALQIVIAAQSFFSPRAALQSAATRVRLAIAAWVTSLGVLCFGFFVVDAGDSDYASTFQVMLGVHSSGKSDSIHAATDLFSEIATGVSALLWFGGFLWLVVEWIIDLAQRRRRATLAAAAAPESLTRP